MTVVSNNGAQPPDVDETVSDAGGTTPLSALRATRSNVHLFRGFGPLVVGLILFVLMVTLAPTVAPEHDVERPQDPPAGESSP